MTQNISSPWPEGYQGAVSLTFDDGARSQLQTAIPIMNDLDLKGTFFVCPRGEDWMSYLEPWREVAKAGHEVGNHSISHICSRALGIDPKATRCLENITLEELEADILEASRRLREGIPEQKEFTFCYPCYHDYVGEGLTRQSYVPIIAKHFPAGRGRGEFGYNHPATCDLAYLWSWNIEHVNAPTLVGLAEQAATLGRWVIFTIHGINEGGLMVSETAFRQLCEFLNRHRERIWVAPMVTIALHIREWRKSQGILRR
ncbi:polysaccharide deacetylase family protein [bacterium]|nr:polysaccharide deacetylase family protein [bacterium]